MAANARSVCLVSMPFAPASMPALGVSTLKAAAGGGRSVEIFYGTLAFLDWFDEGQTAELFSDFELISSTVGLGELMFADALWDRRDARIDAFLHSIADGPIRHVEGVDVAAVMRRFESYRGRAQGFITACADRLAPRGFDVFGFSTTFSQNVASLCLARELKRRDPSVTIVFGGANTEGP